MSSYTIGPKIGLDGEKEFRSSLNSINETLRTLDSELKKTASEFEDNADSQEALKAKNEVLNKSIEQQEKKLTEVKKALEFAKKEYGDSATQTQKWQRVLNNTETDLNKLKSQVKQNEQALENMDNAVDDVDTSLDDMGDSATTAADKTSKLSSVASGIKTGATVAAAGVAAIGTAAVGAVSAINNITESTREYREDMGKLETAFKSAGLSQEAATDTYKDFYSVLGEEDRSVEAVNHLAKLTTNQEELQKWTDICAGVWGTFGDSLPIEGLTEAANETAKTGKVTGVLADALNWAGVSEDEFNNNLASMNSEQERATYITDTLNGLYAEAAENYKTANGAIIDARKAQSELTDATAGLGEALEPVSTSFKYIGADIIESITPGVQLIGEGLTGALNGSAESAGLLGEGLADMATSFIEQIDEMLPILTEVLNTLIPQLLESLILALPSIIESGSQILFSLVNGILNALPSLLEAGLQIIIFLAQAITEQLPELIPTVVNIILQLVETLTNPETLSNLIMAALELILALAEGLVEAMPKLMEVMPTIISNVVTTLINLLPQLIPVAVKLLVTLAQALIQNIGQLLSAVPKIISALFNGFSNSDAGRKAKEWGKDLIQNIIDGIISMINRIKNAVLRVADTISSYLHFSVPDEGPLTKVPQWMPDMIDVLTKGIYSNENKLEKAAGSLASKLQTGMSINADVKNIGVGPTELLFTTPVYLDGKIISNTTQKYVTNQQTAYAVSRGLLRLMREYDFSINGVNAYDLGVFAVRRPNIPAPVKRVSQQTVTGRNGVLVIDEGTYDPVEIKIECNFMSTSPDTFAYESRKVKNWLLSNQKGELIFNDDPDFFYKTQIIQCSEIERASKKIGVFDITCTCEPFTYLSAGKNEIDLPESIQNDFYVAAPIYKLAGEGVFTLTVNGNSFSVNVAQNATIDTSLMLVYRTDSGALINQNTQGEFESLFLKNGVNLIQVQKPSDDSTIKIIPNWRAL